MGIWSRNCHQRTGSTVYGARRILTFHRLYNPVWSRGNLCFSGINSWSHAFLSFLSFERVCAWSYTLTLTEILAMFRIEFIKLYNFISHGFTETFSILFQDWFTMDSTWHIWVYKLWSRGIWFGYSILLHPKIGTDLGAFYHHVWVQNSEGILPNNTFKSDWIRLVKTLCYRTILFTFPFRVVLHITTISYIEVSYKDPCHCEHFNLGMAMCFSLRTWDGTAMHIHTSIH